MKETLVKAEYRIELTPEDHRALCLRCDYQDGNDVINSVLPDDISDWTILDDEPYAVVVIEPSEYTESYSVGRFMEGLIKLLYTELKEVVDEED